MATNTTTPAQTTAPAAATQAQKQIITIVGKNAEGQPSFARIYFDDGITRDAVAALTKHFQDIAAALA